MVKVTFKFKSSFVLKIMKFLNCKNNQYISLSTNNPLAYISFFSSYSAKCYNFARAGKLFFFNCSNKWSYKKFPACSILKLQNNKYLIFVTHSRVVKNFLDKCLKTKQVIQFISFCLITGFLIFLHQEDEIKKQGWGIWPICFTWKCLDSL